MSQSSGSSGCCACPRAEHDPADRVRDLATLEIRWLDRVRVIRRLSAHVPQLDHANAGLGAASIDDVVEHPKRGRRLPGNLFGQVALVDRAGESWQAETGDGPE